MAHLRDDNAKEILGPGLSPLIGRGTLKSLVTFAVYADVLRMVRDTVMADGEISDEEVQESLGLLQNIAGGFAKVRRKDYSAYTALSQTNARAFLASYTADKGLFGHANEATKWAGVELCRNIQSQCGESGPLEEFGSSLVAWGQAIAGSDGATGSEKALLEAVHELAGIGELASGAVLTKEIAQRFLANEQAVDLNSFATIDDAAAEILATYVDHRLRAVLAEAATQLDAHASEGTYDTSGMCDLSFCDEFADLRRALPLVDGFRHPRRGLANDFCCAYGFDAETAQALSVGTPRSIRSRVAYFFIDDAFASNLADEDFQQIKSLWIHVTLYGDWDDGPTPGWLVEASKLPERSGIPANLPLSSEALEAFEPIADDMLVSLEGVSRLSPLSARSLSQVCCDLVLGVMPELDPATAGVLAEHRYGSLSLGLSECSEATAIALSKHQGTLRLEMPECPENVARALGRHSGRLILCGFSSLEATAANGLAQHRGDLVLEVTHLSDAAAACVSQHEETLSLPYLETLSDAAAKSLSEHKGDLELGDYLCIGRDDALTRLSNAAVGYLAKHSSLSTNPELEARLKAERKHAT